MLPLRMMNAGPTNAKETLLRAGAHGPPASGGGGGYGYGGGYGGHGGGGYGGPPMGGPVGPPGFGPPGGFPPPGGPMTPGGAPEVNTTRPLLLNALSAVCCFWGVASLVVAIVGIVLSVQAMNAQKVGDLHQARGKARLGTILAFASYGLAALAAVMYWLVLSG